MRRRRQAHYGQQSEADFLCVDDGKRPPACPQDRSARANEPKREDQFPFHATSKSRIVQTVLVIPAAMQGVILIAVFTLTKLYHATQSATQAL